jgi:hypothetical protein
MIVDPGKNDWIWMLPAASFQYLDSSALWSRLAVIRTIDQISDCRMKPAFVTIGQIFDCRIKPAFVTIGQIPDSRIRPAFGTSVHAIDNCSETPSSSTVPTSGEQQRKAAARHQA